WAVRRPRRGSAPRDRHTVNAKAGGSDRRSQLEVIGDHIDPLQNFIEGPRDCDLPDRVAQLTVDDLEALGAARKVACHRIETVAHHAGYVEPALDAGEQLLGTMPPRLHDEVRDRRVRHTATATARAGRGHLQLPGAVG